MSKLSGDKINLQKPHSRSVYEKSMSKTEDFVFPQSRIG